ncbi:hypothetical protein I316_07366 [Kwoniella heveanensis BCC8398]|uniref:Xylanolytic transcriptional activator regulatory domain-containing protein n=1 Tax=Kwoniella heveanensis BCC8398 TaxID=1296120 RepID=A0A1B9GIP6_9TREE|nr:hypothetical protein I316_07366 [Kwoniella heveanensis BCC8398]
MIGLEMEAESDERYAEGGSEPSSDLREWSQDHLVEAETGDVQVHGPTSAFRHLGKYSHERVDAFLAASEPSPGSPDDLPRGFARYLPTDVYLTKEQHDLALDRFFTYYACWGQRSHPILFRRDMEIALSGDSSAKMTSYSPMLHNAIMAIALGMSDEYHLRDTDTRSKFAKKAKDFIDHEGMKPSVATVQAFAHLASYHSLAAEHNLGWLYIGMALRTGVALGLNMDDAKLVKRGNVTASQAQERNVTFWTTFIQEGLWAPYIGRSISLPDFTAQPPTVDIELDQMLWEDKSTPPGMEPILKPQPSMISTTFIHTVKLMRIGERIMNTLYGIKADMATLLRTGVISEISLSLSTWLEALPPCLTFNNNSPKNGLPHILMLHLSHAWLVILLHRPFYRPLAGMPTGAGTGGAIPATQSTAAWAQCDRAALHVIMLLQTWHRLHDLRYCMPTAIQCCFIAGTTHLLALASSSAPKKQAEALGRAQDCIQLMKFMAVSWPAARHQQILLENLLAEYGVSAGVQTTIADIPSQDQPEHHASASMAAHSYQDYDLFSQNIAHPDHMIPQPTSFAAQAQTQVQAMPDIIPITGPSQTPLQTVGPIGNWLEPSRPLDDLSAWLGVTISDATSIPPAPMPSNDPFAMGAMPNSQPDLSWPIRSVNPLPPNAEWDPSNFGYDRETQALLDNILRPHLDVLGSQNYGTGPAM